MCFPRSLVLAACVSLLPIGPALGQERAVVEARLEPVRASGAGAAGAGGGRGAVGGGPPAGTVGGGAPAGGGAPNSAAAPPSPAADPPTTGGVIGGNTGVGNRPGNGATGSGASGSAGAAGAGGGQGGSAGSNGAAVGPPAGAVGGGAPRGPVGGGTPPIAPELRRPQLPFPTTDVSSAATPAWAISLTTVQQAPESPAELQLEPGRAAWAPRLLQVAQPSVTGRQIVQPSGAAARWSGRRRSSSRSCRWRITQ